ncbi:ribonuclease R [Vagococcus xieshaowenii]|uniref:Ribonuclease R n=1 Tax=Vagococcus xieshaowenii TaxID=2562451 RepID=A0AAJ5EGC3_9ENTE|nr:ribonuclease R [Vagococcus xieshaowenii]QCA28503.1 ribonuclease R [Vagococcus xieshaowenii]TFZ42742.1 ribonuclease R [Vagococcus xieshaowenii]
MKKTIRESIISFMETSDKASFSIQEIAAGLELEQSQNFKLLVQTIASMERDKEVEFTSKGKIKLPMELTIEGTFRANDRGFGFVTISPEEPDVYIAKEMTNFALNGDTVKLDIIKPGNPIDNQAAEGRIVEVIARAMTQLVGEFVAYDEDLINETGLYGYISPKSKLMSHYKVYIAAEGIHPEDGEICVVEITHYPEKGYEDQIEGIVKQTIGHKNEPGMDILTIAMQHGILTEFSADTLAHAEKVPEEVPEEDMKDRLDLRDELIITIDGADAKDLDDAVQVKKLSNGNYQLGVYIADVSHYVTEGSPLDIEAQERGTSVYLTDRVIPMLPTRLSNGICSLNPQVNRLTMSCRMEIDQQGHVVDYEIFESVIKSTERMTYSDVNQLIAKDDDVLTTKYQHLYPMIDDMTELHGILEAMRKERGAISFEDKESKIYLDNEGNPIEIVLRERGIAERMIESFMLAANETVARHFHERMLPFIYRIHEHPKESKIQTFFEFISNFGVSVKGVKDDIEPRELQKVLEQAADLPEKPIISMMLLRSMQQAKYSEESLGHYGLAATYYTHFTSPIRRYPDLLVHRLIKEYAKENPVSEKLQAKWQAKIPDIALHSSQMERRAVEAERETDAMKKAQYMEQFVGETFEGVISSVTKFGVFVELPNTVEGLIHINQLKDDYYQYIESHLALVGERTRKIYKIGQRVVVKVVKVDVDNREIDFEILSSEVISDESITLKQSNRQRKERRNDRVTKSGKYPEKKDAMSSSTNKGKKKTAPFYNKVAKGKKKKK